MQLKDLESRFSNASQLAKKQVKNTLRHLRSFSQARVVAEQEEKLQPKADNSLVPAFLFCTIGHGSFVERGCWDRLNILLRSFLLRSAQHFWVAILLEYTFFACIPSVQRRGFASVYLEMLKFSSYQYLSESKRKVYPGTPQLHTVFETFFRLNGIGHLSYIPLYEFLWVVSL